MASSPTSGKRKADLKVVILGDAAVGKTTLVHRYIEGKFEETISTIGASFFLKQWGPYNVAVWDTAGEEKYSGLSSFYCRGAGAAILAYDIREGKTFESLWARFTPLLEAADEKCVRVVVGTKLDLVKPGSREITLEEGEHFASEINEHIPKDRLKHIPYFETSSVTGESVEKMFEFILDYCLPLTEEMKLSMEGNTIHLKDSKTDTVKKNGCAC
ncbi:ras-related protein Rab-20-like [Liolophura sinensis]|uniref:ras-related protein Rab-20-like n=1 Tax=Liolophura sinensis TaxID=3198878 RepID=UPI003158270E